MRLLEEHGAICGTILTMAAHVMKIATASTMTILIDLETGKVIEFRSDKIEKLQCEIAAELGYDIVRHRLELYCKKRSSKSVRQPAPTRTKK